MKTEKYYYTICKTNEKKLELNVTEIRISDNKITIRMDSISFKRNLEGYLSSALNILASRLISDRMNDGLCKQIDSLEKENIKDIPVGGYIPYSSLSCEKLSISSALDGTVGYKSHPFLARAATGAAWLGAIEE